MYNIWSWAVRGSIAEVRTSFQAGSDLLVLSIASSSPAWEGTRNTSGLDATRALDGGPTPVDWRRATERATDTKSTLLVASDDLE